jgi:hypothetical protein
MINFTNTSIYNLNKYYLTTKHVKKTAQCVCLLHECTFEHAILLKRLATLCPKCASKLQALQRVLYHVSMLNTLILVLQGKYYEMLH